MSTDRTRDPFDVLTAARPTDERLDEAWTDTRSEAALRVIAGRLDAEQTAGTGVVPLAPPRLRGLTRRRWLAVGAVAAAAAFASAVGVLAPDAALPRATAVEQLAARAASAPVTVAGPGQFVHVVSTTTQERRDDQTPQVDETSESWVDATGTIWRRDVSRTAPVGTTYYKFEPVALDDDPFWGKNAADYAQWPTDPVELRAFLSAHLSNHAPGKTIDGSQPIFENVSDRLGSGLTSPQLNAALIRVIGSLPEVSVADVSYAGHDAVRLEYRGMYVDALYFDKETAAYLGETSPGAETRILTQDVVDQVPAEVLAKAVLQGNEDSAASVNGTTPTT